MCSDRRPLPLGPSPRRVLLAAALAAWVMRAELAAKWRSLRAAEGEPFALVHRTAQLRREVGAQLTDAMRVALLRRSGYAVAVSELVAAEHTPKNRLLVASRLPAAQAAAQRERARDEYDDLRRATGGRPVALGRARAAAGGEGGGGPGDGARASGRAAREPGRT